MAIELRILALGALLLVVHIFTATRFKTAQYGRKWNIGARDEVLAPPNPVTGRTMRAQANFEETFPIAIVALLGVVLANRTSELTAVVSKFSSTEMPSTKRNLVPVIASVHCMEPTSVNSVPSPSMQISTILISSSGFESQ